MMRLCRIPAWICVLLVLVANVGVSSAQVIGTNWGTLSSNPLPPGKVVQFLKENNMTKVKLFDADSKVLEALKGSGLEVMVAAPNDMLETLQNLKAARAWVKANISYWRQSNRVNIAYAAIGNEPFLSSYNGTFVPLVLPALQNVQQAIVEANLQDVVKVVVPMNADVLSNATNLPSKTFFRADILSLMQGIVNVLQKYGSPFLVNLYPYLSLIQEATFPKGFAFFSGDPNAAFTDNDLTYTNVLEASIDQVSNALAAVGAPNMPVVLGEVGWPTDGQASANIAYAQEFNQGLLDHMFTFKGTPRNPGRFIDFYLFGLLDENEKSVAPGPFERHWGILTYDGKPKYPLDLSGRGLNRTLVAVRDVKYLPTQWCILKSGAETSPLLQANLNYACSRADCTPLDNPAGPCGGLTMAGKASYAFNIYFQENSQVSGSCNFQNLASVTTTNPALKYGNSCLFPIQVETSFSIPLGFSRYYAAAVALTILALSL